MALASITGAGPALPPLPAYPPASLPQPSALHLAVDIGSLSGQVLPGAGPAAAPSSEDPAGLAQEPDQAAAGLAAWVLRASLQCELRSAWVRVFG